MMSFFRWLRLDLRDPAGEAGWRLAQAARLFGVLAWPLIVLVIIFGSGPLAMVLLGALFFGSIAALFFSWRYEFTAVRRALGDYGPSAGAFVCGRCGARASADDPACRSCGQLFRRVL